MISLKDKIQEELFKLIDELIDKHVQLDQPATGDWIKGLEAEAEIDGGRIKGLNYTEYISGNPRGGGRMPPIKPLERWVRAKFGVSGKEGRSIAFAVANKIAAEGTDIYPQGTDLIDGVLTEERLQKVTENIGAFATQVLTETMVRDLKRA